MLKFITAQYTQKQPVRINTLLEQKQNNSWYWGEMPENYMTFVNCIRCIATVYFLKPHVVSMSTHTHSWWYCIGLMSAPICHCCSPCCTGSEDAFLSAIIYVVPPPPSLPAPACHTEKASLSCYTATTMWCLRGTLACVRQPRVPTERLPWMCLSLKSSLISCQEDKRKVKVALSPPHHLLHIPSDVCFMVLPSSFVVAFTCK